MHETLGLNLVSDYFTKPDRPLPEVAGKTIADALEHVGASFGSEWITVGETVVFRSRSWPEDEPKEVPNRLIVRWQAALVRQGYLGLDHLAEVGQLTDDQWACLMVDLPEVLSLYPHRPLIRFYASLARAERLAARSTAGLDLSRTSVSQIRNLIEPVPHFAMAQPPSFEFVGLADYVTGRFYAVEQASKQPPSVIFRLTRNGLTNYGRVVALPLRTSQTSRRPPTGASGKSNPVPDSVLRGDPVSANEPAGSDAP